MDEKICKICDINKPIEEYHYRLGVRVNYCKSCLLQRRGLIDDYGINLPTELQTSQTKYFIRGARELLTNMGYDLNLPIYLQFNERLRVKYGKDMF
jgi:hypothetical protein